jgi:hypothetical protein
MMVAAAAVDELDMYMLLVVVDTLLLMDQHSLFDLLVLT